MTDLSIATAHALAAYYDREPDAPCPRCGEGRARRPTRVQQRIMRRMHSEGLLLLAESNLECWLFGTTDDGMVGEPVERVSDITAERLVLRGFVRGSGDLTRLGLDAIGVNRRLAATRAGDEEGD